MKGQKISRVDAMASSLVAREVEKPVVTHKLFSIYDSDAKTFGLPLGFTTRGLALRWFQDNLIGNPQSDVCKHPEKFSFFEIGEFAAVSGRMTEYDKPENLGLASQFKQ